MRLVQADYRFSVRVEVASSAVVGAEKTLLIISVLSRSKRGAGLNNHPES